MIKKILVVAVALATLLTVATVASADHSWNGYHWPSDNLSPTVVDKTSSLYDVPAAITEWSGLNTPIQPEMATSSKGNITVTEAFSPFWLGLARIFIEDGHITKGEVKLNTRLLNSYPAAAADHVLCQEIGHVLGLDHNRDGATGGAPDNSCMNDSLATLGLYTAPNGHDTDTLKLIYAPHGDVVDGGGDAGGGGPDCGKNSNAKKCRSGNGVWITVHVFWAE